jgi:3-phosphoshikimate 1-carboxyvinyltransferase
MADLGVGVTHRDGHLPVTIEARGPGGWAREVAIRGDVSSQFISGLMLAAPWTPHGLRVRLTTPLVSRPYLEMTADVMAAFGAGATMGEDEVSVPAGRYAGRTYVVEPDASAASYFFAVAAVTGGSVTVEGLGRASRQGDRAFVDVLAAMGAEVSSGPDWTRVDGPAGGVLRAVDVDMADISDTAPTFGVVAAFAEGTSRARGIGFIRAKESDRIAAVVAGLAALGVDAVETEDGFDVHGAGWRGGTVHGGAVETHDDHRIAMSFAIAGLLVPGVEILGPGCVAKTFPGFWAALDGLRR